MIAHFFQVSSSVTFPYPPAYYINLHMHVVITPPWLRLQHYGRAWVDITTLTAHWLLYLYFWCILLIIFIFRYSYYIIYLYLGMHIPLFLFCCSLWTLVIYRVWRICGVLRSPTYTYYRDSTQPSIFGFQYTGLLVLYIQIWCVTDVVVTEIGNITWCYQVIVQLGYANNSVNE